MPSSDLTRAATVVLLHITLALTFLLLEAVVMQTDAHEISILLQIFTPLP